MTYEEMKAIYDRGETVIEDGHVYNKNDGEELPDPIEAAGNDPDALAKLRQEAEEQIKAAQANLDRLQAAADDGEDKKPEAKASEKKEPTAPPVAAPRPAKLPTA